MLSQILELSKDDELAKAAQRLNKKLDEVMLTPAGPSRWRAVAKVLHDTNPISGEDAQGNPLKFREINQDCIIANKIWRDTADDKYGRSQDKAIKKGVGSGSAWRGYLSMPRVLKYAIEQADPEAFKSDKNAKKMFKAFPEYTNAEVY